MLLCSLVGMFLATPGMVPWDILIFGNLGIALVAGSAAADESPDGCENRYGHGENSK
jgi:heme O synthase-like polyprenyltransferase